MEEVLLLGDQFWQLSLERRQFPKDKYLSVDLGPSYSPRVFVYLHLCAVV